MVQYCSKYCSQSGTVQYQAKIRAYSTCTVSRVINNLNLVKLVHKIDIVYRVNRPTVSLYTSPVPQLP